MGDFLLFFAGVREMFGSDVIVVKYDGDGAITVCDDEWSQGLVPTEGVSGSIDVEKFGFGVAVFEGFAVGPFAFVRGGGFLPNYEVCSSCFFLPLSDLPVCDNCDDGGDKDDD